MASQNLDVATNATRVGSMNSPTNDSTNASTTGDASAFAAGTSGTSLPPVSLPAGGGSMRGMGETFSMNPFNGTATFSVPLPSSQSRSGIQPGLSLDYSSGTGSSPFGLGWSLSGLAEITRKTSRGLPKYLDNENSDIFIISGAEDLVPQYYQRGPEGEFSKDANGQFVIDETVREDYLVRRYRPRVETTMFRIERWTSLNDPKDVYWRQISPDNETMIYGRDSSSRIESVDAQGKSRIFSWLLCSRLDCKGNAISYEYKAEDTASVDISKASESNRELSGVSSQKYLKRVKYGNRTPASRSTRLADVSDWMFEIVFDYGEHDPYDPRVSEEQTHTWKCRADAYSVYKSGFEVRTYRLCERVMMFHHFPDELGRQDYLVNTLQFSYEADPSLTLLKRIQTTRFALPATHDLATVPGTGPYLSQAIPPLDFQYTSRSTHEQIRSLQPVPTAVEDAAQKHQWVDLLCEGITGMLLSSNDEWYYKRNLSPLSSHARAPAGSAAEPGWEMIDSINLAPRRLVGSRPSLQSSNGRSQLLDLEGNGNLEVVYMENQPPGFFRSTLSDINSVEAPSDTWASYQAFVNIPNFDLGDPNLRFIDLTGNGRADLLITHDDCLVWYESQGSAGFEASANVIALSQDEASAPHLLFSDPTQSVYLADFSGDGLIDIVRIRNGHVCYWPNLGYGKFGRMVTMDNAPTFDTNDGFSTTQILLGDVDGSGSTDILYFSNSMATIYYNLAGNGFSDGVQLASLGISIDAETQVAAIDLRGTGTMSLVFTSSKPSDESGLSMRFVDLMGGVKPHLLEKVVNNTGTETSYSYRSSVAYYLEDEAEGRPWATRLPYPQHCVDRTVSVDLLNRTTMVTKFRYHHGYYDSIEREFRGFGMVEQWDSESFQSLSAFSNTDNINRETYMSPSHRKTWYHLGAYTDHERLSRLYARDYYGATTEDFDAFFDSQLRDVVSNLPADATMDLQYQASRALKGSPLRVETYADDSDIVAQQALIPYQIQDFGNSVSLKQPVGPASSLAVFHHLQREEISHLMERQAIDSRRSHTIALAVDAFGNTTKSVAISYGREVADPLLDATSQAIQAKTKITYTEVTFTNFIDKSDVHWTEDYRHPMLCGSKLFELAGIFERSRSLKPSDFDTLQDLPEVGYDYPGPSNTSRKRLLRANETNFRKDDLSGFCALGQVEALALPGINYALRLTPSIMATFSHNGQSLLPPNDSNIVTETGHIDLKHDGNWWTISSAIFYHPEDTSAADELSAARSNFFQPLRVVDPYGNSLIEEYDKHKLRVVLRTDAAANTTHMEYDYRVLGASSLTDSNGNRTVCQFDILGQVAVAALMGKPGENIGDSLATTPSSLSQDAIDAFFADPTKNARTLLGTATTRFIYDIQVFQKDGKTPFRSAQISRAVHAHDPGGTTSQIEISVEYINGTGRTIQTKTLAETEKAGNTTARWICSGWTVQNNKGLPVQSFEPFFSNTVEFERDNRVGVSKIIIYDTLNREVGNLLPNKTWTKTKIGAWENKLWDANDTILLDSDTDEVVGSTVRQLSKDVYSPSWFQARQTADTSKEESLSASKSTRHADTPTTLYNDALGTPFKETKLDENRNAIEEYHISDADGTLKEVKDPSGRTTTTNIFDMLGGVIKTVGMNTGSQWRLTTSSGEKYLAWDSRGHQFSYAYDMLRRPTTMTCQNDTEGVSKYVRHQIQYGESSENATNKNLRGRVLAVRDQSGILFYQGYNFKGNLLSTERWICKDYRTNIDWAQAEAIEFEDEKYVTRSTYDALNRRVEHILPDGTMIDTAYNQRGLLESQRCNLRGEVTVGNEKRWRSIITSRTYDAHGRITEHVAGNKTTTSRVFDPTTFRLSRLTVKGEKTVIQDLQFTYDPVGNTIFTLNHAQQTVFFRNNVVDPHSEFTYDALYRLVASTGREHLGTTKGHAPGPELDTVLALDAPANGQAMVRYTESYTYDNCNNILSVRHQIDDAKQPGWTRKYFYNNASKLNENEHSNELTSTQVGNVTSSYSYDIHGNTTSMPHLSKLEWDCFDNIRSLSRQRTQGDLPESTWYSLDHEGGRVHKITERAPTSDDQSHRKLSETISIGDYQIYREFDGAGHITKECRSINVASGGTSDLLIEFWSGSKNKASPLLLRFQVQDSRDSIAIELDENGSLISSEEFSPFGSTTFQSLRIRQAPKRYRFAGKKRDKESGLDHYLHRYYIPWLGRWMSSDPLGIADGINTYDYVQNNPIDYTDPQGLCSDEESKSKAGPSSRKDAKRPREDKLKPKGKEAKKSRKAEESSEESEGESKKEASEDESSSSESGPYDAKTLKRMVAAANRGMEAIQSAVQYHQCHLIRKADLESDFQPVLDLHEYTLIMDAAVHSEFTNRTSRKAMRKAWQKDDPKKKAEDEELYPGMDQPWIEWKGGKEWLEIMGLKDEWRAAKTETGRDEIKDDIRTRVEAVIDRINLATGLPPVSYLRENGFLHTYGAGKDSHDRQSSYYGEEEHAAYQAFLAALKPKPAAKKTSGGGGGSSSTGSRSRGSSAVYGKGKK